MHPAAKHSVRRPLPAWRSHGRLTLRVLAGIGGGYACTVALASASAQLLVQLAGIAAHEAVLIVCMLGFVVYLGLLIWAFAEPRLWRLCLLLLLGIAGYLAPQFGLLAPLPRIAGAG